MIPRLWGSGSETSIGRLDAIGGELSGWEVSLELYGVRKHLWDQRMALGEALAHLQSLSVAGLIVKRLSPNAVSWLPMS